MNNSKISFDDLLELPLPSKIHTKENMIEVFKFSFADLFTEETLHDDKDGEEGHFDLKDGLSSVTIAVFGGEREYAHFHIISSKGGNNKNGGNSDGSFISCPSLIYPAYFFHDGKKGVLNSKQRKKLYELLSKPTENEFLPSHFTKYQELCYYWNINNHNILHIDINKQIMPNYRELDGSVKDYIKNLNKKEIKK